MVSERVDVPWAAAHPAASVLHEQVAAELPGEDSMNVEMVMWLARLGRLVEMVGNRIRAESVDLDVSEHAVLACLLFSGSPHQLSPTALSQMVVQTTGGMAKTLRRLEQRGYVKRVRDRADGRALHVVLTAKGVRTTRGSLAGVARSWRPHLDAGDAIDPDVLTMVVGLVSALEHAAGIARP